VQYSQATQNEFANAVAMAAPVVIDGVPFIHLVVFAGALNRCSTGRLSFTI
jgi:hypothetical protein